MVLDTNWEQDVVSAQLAAVAVALMAALRVAAGVLPQPGVVVLAVAVGLRAAPAAHLLLKEPGAVEPGPVLLELRQWEDAAVPERQVGCRRQALAFAGAEQASPVQRARQALAAWACQRWEMLPGPVGAVALASLARIGAAYQDAALVEAAALSQSGQSVQTRSLMLPALVAR